MRYVYGVVRAGHPPVAVKGVGAPPVDVRLVESGPLTAAVSDVDDDFLVEENDARTHVHVLIELLGGGPVVPIRLGTVAPDDNAVRAEVLDAARPDLVDCLDALDGKVELHVDVDDNEAEAIAAVAGTGPMRAGEPLDVASALELGQRVAELLIEHRQHLADEIVAKLRPLAIRDTPRAVIEGPEDPVLRWAFLINTDDLASFDEAVAGVRAAYPNLAVRYVGPLPAAHFVDWRARADASADAQLPDHATHDTFQANGSWGW